MRAILTILLMAATLPCFAQEGSSPADTSAQAKAIYDALAKKVLEGARLSIVTKGTVRTPNAKPGDAGHGQFAGAMHTVKDKLSISIDMQTGGNKMNHRAVVSGTTLWTEIQGGGQNKTITIKPGMAKRMRSIFLMGGFFFAGRFGGRRSDGKTADEVCKVGRFALGSDDNAGEGKPLQIITYDFRVVRFENAARVTLWIDRATGLPTKREVRVSNRPGAPLSCFTEVYSSAAVDGPAPEGTFALPKAKPADPAPPTPK